MQIYSLSTKDWWKAVGIGVGTAVLLAILNVIALKTGVSPLPKPLSLAFAETLFGGKLPLLVGLLFHVGWVTFFSVSYVVLFRDQLTFQNAFLLALALWAVTLVIFMPIVGWGFLGLGVGPKLILAATMSHLLFALFLWALSLMSLTPSARLEAQRESG